MCKNLLGATAGFVSLSGEGHGRSEMLVLDTGDVACTVDPNLPSAVRGMREVAYRAARPLYSNEFGASPWESTLPAGHLPLQNVLLAPMLVEGKTVGLLGLANKPGGFSDEDAETAGLFGGLAAGLLDASRITDALGSVERRFRAVSDGATDALVALDARGRVTFWNKAAERLFGRSEQGALGAPFAEFIAEESRDQFAHRPVPCSSTLGLIGVHPDGRRFPIAFSCAGWDSADSGQCTAIIRSAPETGAEVDSEPVERDLERQVQARTRELVRMNQELQRGIVERARVNAELELEKTNLRNILNAMQDGVTIIRPDHTIEYVNPALERDFGVPGNRRCHEYFHNLSSPCTWCRMPQVLAGSSEHIEWRSSASGRAYDEFATPFRRANGEVGGLSILRDITDSKRAEEELRESQRLIERIADATPYILYVYDLPTRTHVYINQRLTDVLGYPPSTFSVNGEERAEAIVHPDDRESRAQRFARIARAQDGELVETEYRMRHADGEYRWLHVRDTVFSRSADGSVLQILGVARDITELKRIERNLLDASEAERRRIGQDLHDGLGQVLAGIALLAKRVERQVEAQTLPAIDDVRRLVQLIVDAMHHAGSVSSGLFPVALECAGLRAALEELASGIQKVFEVSCEVVGESHGCSILPSRAIHFFRIAQEAVHNAVRHGGARRIRISLDETAEATTLAVRDDGCGIAEDATSRRGTGLISMERRARIMGGSLAIRRHPDGGTIVSCRVSAANGGVPDADVDRFSPGGLHAD